MPWEKQRTCSKVAGAYQALLKQCFLSRWLWQLTLDETEHSNALGNFLHPTVSPVFHQLPRVPSGRHGGHMALREKNDDENQGQGRLSLESAGFTWTKNKELLMEELLHQLTWRNICHSLQVPYTCAYIYIYMYENCQMIFEPLRHIAMSVCFRMRCSKIPWNFWTWIISKEFLETTHWWRLWSVCHERYQQIPQVYVTNSEPGRSCFKWLSQVQETQLEDPKRHSNWK